MDLDRIIHFEKGLKIYHGELQADIIKKVETGLIHPVYLEGDSTWTIEARMKHYHVPGVSIAVINNGKIEWILKAEGRELIIQVKPIKKVKIIEPYC